MKSPGQWTMKTFSLSSIVLAFFLGVHLGAAMHGNGISGPCCFHYTHDVIPWSWVYTYENAKGNCPQEIVILHTKRGKYCVKPEAKWVQRYISLLKAQKRL